MIGYRDGKTGPHPDSTDITQGNEPIRVPGMDMHVNGEEAFPEERIEVRKLETDTR